MFDRFSTRAARVLFHARSEAGSLGSRVIEPEHILLGILDSGGLGSQILAGTSDGVDELRRAIVRRAVGGEKVPVSNETAFSASCKRALQYAVEEADALSHNNIGTEHLLLGLLREERTVATEMLAARGVTIEGVREAIATRLRSGEQPEPPGPPGSPANTYTWPRVPFVPSHIVHILYSGMQWPTQPVINSGGGTHFGAYGFTLEEIIVSAWEGNRWHVDMTSGLCSDTRFDFLMVLSQRQSSATCLGLLRSAIEQQFAVDVTIENRLRDVYVLTHTVARRHMLRRYPDQEPGVGYAFVRFPVFMHRTKDTPMFPLDAFAVHSWPFIFLVKWFEEILGGQVIDEARLPGIYGFELKERVSTPERFIQLLREEAGLLITKDRREIPTLVVRNA